MPIGDWPLHILNARRGDIVFLDQDMAVHRVHAQGAWMGLDSAEQMRRTLAVLRVLRNNAEGDDAPALDDSWLEKRYRFLSRARVRGRMEFIRAIFSIITDVRNLTFLDITHLPGMVAKILGRGAGVLADGRAGSGTKL